MLWQRESISAETAINTEPQRIKIWQIAPSLPSIAVPVQALDRPLQERKYSCKQLFPQKKAQLN